MIHTVVNTSYGKPRVMKLKFITIKDINEKIEKEIHEEHNQKKKMKAWLPPSISKRDYCFPNYLTIVDNINDADFIIADHNRNNNKIYDESNVIVEIPDNNETKISKHFVESLSLYGCNKFYMTLSELIEFENMSWQSYTCRQTTTSVIKDLSYEDIKNKPVYDIESWNFKDFGKTIFTLEQAEEYLRMLFKKSNSNNYWRNYYIEPNSNDDKFIMESMRCIDVENSIDGLTLFFYIAGCYDRHKPILKKLYSWIKNKHTHTGLDVVNYYSSLNQSNLDRSIISTNCINKIKELSYKYEINR